MSQIEAEIAPLCRALSEWGSAGGPVEVVALEIYKLIVKGDGVLARALHDALAAKTSGDVP